MFIDDFVGRLQGVKKTGKGYSCKCPAHDDRTASLSVDPGTTEDGEPTILVYCHAGCSKDAILGAMGLKFSDLYVKPRKGNGRRGSSGGNAKKNSGNAKKNSGNAKNGGMSQKEAEDAFAARDAKRNQGTEAPEGMTVHTVGSGAGAPGSSQGGWAGSPGGSSGSDGQGGNSSAQGSGNGSSSSGNGKKEKEPELQIDWNHPDKIYSYQGEDGKELFQVVRYHFTNGPGKTFRQRMRATEEQKRNSGKDGWPKVTREGFINKVPDELRDVTLYRMPKVMEAIRTGKPVYVVEGEKDVETMERLGYVATCNPGGAGKWQDGYTRILAGGDIIILPDNDTKGNEYKGQVHAWTVASRLDGIAKRVRLVDIREACPEIPPKGDISDMVEIMGDTDAMDALAKQVTATKNFDKSVPGFWWTPIEQATALYSQVTGYGVADGCIVQRTGDTTKPLTDFVVIPRMELTKDDGLERRTFFVLDGWNSEGRKLPRVSISGEAMDNMSFVTKEWGFDANLVPGSTTKNKVSWAIQKVGQRTAKKVTEYGHTGWRKIEGKWCYLYQGGAIGAEGVTVDLGNALKNYRLDGSGAEGFDRIKYREGAEQSWKITEVMKKSCAVALLGCMYLAPLREFLNQTDVVPAFALFLYGSTGTHKTTAAALALSHFGNFHAKNPPSNFRSTGNAITQQAFTLKDMPLLVDDYHPTESAQEKRQMAATAQALSRAFGDGNDRTRMNADGSLREKKPPRSLAVITGEDLPAVGVSGLARFLIVNIEKGDIPLTGELTELQEKARKGYLQKAMRGFITWISQQIDDMPGMLHDMFLKYREIARKAGGLGHDRAPEAIACVLVGYTMMLRYFRGCGMMDAETCQRELEDGMRALTEMSRKQAADAERDKPTRVYLDTITELIQSQRVWVKDLRLPEIKAMAPTVHMIGYEDADYYYLMPKMAFPEVTKICREKGSEFPLSEKALYKSMKEEGGIINPANNGDACRVKKVDGKPTRLLWIYKRAMGGTEEEAKQTEMDMTAQATPTGEQLPEGW